jgi:hypothetical protein
VGNDRTNLVLADRQTRVEAQHGESDEIVSAVRQGGGD